MFVTLFLKPMAMHVLLRGSSHSEEKTSSRFKLLLVRWFIRVYKNIQGYTRVYRGIRGYTYTLFDGLIYNTHGYFSS